MKKYTLVAIVLGLLCKADSCESSETRDSRSVDRQQAVYAKSQPLPFFEWSQDRDNLIQIYKLNNDSVATHSVVRSAGTGEILWDCPSIGKPLAADTQLTNPLQVYGNGVAIEQAEPNGLFSSKNTDGTYVICVLPDGSLSPQYTEEKVESFSRPIKIAEDKNGKLHVEFVDGKASMVLKRGGK